MTEEVERAVRKKCEVFGTPLFEQYIYHTPASLRLTHVLHPLPAPLANAARASFGFPGRQSTMLGPSRASLNPAVRHTMRSGSRETVTACLDPRPSPCGPPLFWIPWWWMLPHMVPYILSCMAPELKGCPRVALDGALGNLNL